MKHLLAIAGLLAAVSACTPSGAPAGPGEAGVLNVYSARHYDSDRLLYAAFEEETGIRVNVREAGAPELLETMKAEGERSVADVIIASDAGALYRFQDAGFTRAVSSPALEAAIPAQLREKDGHWFGLTLRSRIIVYDPSRIAPEAVDTYADLADPALKGEVCVRSSTNIYNLSLMGELIGRLGPQAAEDWARAVAANMARPPQGGDTAQIEAVAAGECGVALVNHYYWVRLANGSEADRQKAAATALSFPDQEGAGTHVNVVAAAVAAGAPSPDLAVRFLEFLATPHGQKLLTAQTGDYPVVAGAPLPEGLADLPAFRKSDFPLTQLGSHQGEAQAIFDRAGWN